MPDLPTSNPKQFIQCAPILQVPDPSATATYYRDVLGFEWDFAGDDYAVVWCENAAVHLAKAAAGEAPASGVKLFMWVHDVDAIFRDVLERGAEVTVEPADRPYGIRDFSVRDPNGIEVVFGQDID